MDYTTSPDYGVAANGQRLHQDEKNPSTVISRRDLNMLIWSLMEVLKAAGISGKEFSPGDPDSYQRLLRSMRMLFADAPATAAAIEALMDGQVAGLVGFPTRADMDASLAYPDSTIALVTNDADPANNSYYRKVGDSGAGHWAMSDYPSQAVIADLQNRLATAESQTVVLQVADVDGFVFVQMLQDGTVETPGLRLGPRILANDTFGLEAGASAALRMVDADGFWIDVVGDAGRLPGATETGRADGVRVVDAEGFYIELLDPAGNTSAQERVDRDIEAYGARNSRNLASSGAVKTTVNSVVCPWAWNYNHIAFYGQSLEAAWETWPALSRVSRYASNVMLGGSVRPVTDTGPFEPVGGSSAFQPMIAVVQDADTGAVLTDAQVAALGRGNGARGESPAIGAVNFAKRLHNQRVGVLDDANRNFVATSSGVGGRTIEALSKGATPDLWRRLVAAIQAARDNAAAASKTYGIGAFVWIQGEWNYDAAQGGTTTKEGYKAKLAQLWSDFQADCVTGIAAQSAQPAFITYQTGAGYTRDSTDLSIGMAQWEFTKENAGCYLATPIYPFTDKGGHLDANGSRWFGLQLGKVLHRIVEMRQDWKPLSPRRAEVAGRVISIDFHVPEPPLQFALPYVQSTAQDYADKGFTVLDDNGRVPIASVRIVLDTVVEIVCTRDFVGQIKIRYADQTYHWGNGCLCDSDATVAPDNYEYEAGRGFYPEANLPALIGKPYPLRNWCIAFSISPDTTY
ncbi:hypothetical protein [Burkholderia cenocepacia]|uniref:hypothetical protein n=1 Tax=Burkholderia cenocepacia TaxID=95486 RepID=UPI00158E5D2B|nr:hypothetical protein [Burkholderia cenocepacia]